MLLFTDLDETLLTTDKKISEKNLAALRYVAKNSDGVVLCTGRPLYSVKKLAREYGLTGKGYYLAAFNGGQIVDTIDYKELYHEGITKELTRFLFDEAKKEGLYAQSYNDDMILVEEDSEYIKWYSERIKMPYTVVPDVIEALEGEPLKCIVAHPTDHEKLEAFQKKQGKSVGHLTQNMFSNPVLLEFGSAKATKGIAVAELAAHLGVDIKDTFACGDEENDISMIEAAGLGVAVKNARERVLAAADYITENDNDNDAIYEVVKNFLKGFSEDV